MIASNTVHPTDDSLNVSQSYTYDNMGKLIKATNNNLTTTYAYDSLGRKTEEIEYDSNGYSTFNGFFYVGVSQQVERQIVGINNLLMYSNTAYIYDDEMRVIEVIESGTTTATYTYDANGNKASQTLANGVVSTYTYNNANLITHILNTSGDMTISEYEYSYYLDGSDSCKTRTENGIIETTSYEYDGLKRLTKESVTTGSTTDTYAYEYDDYGNRIEMTVTGSENYATTYSYDDAQGNYTALLQKESKTSADETPLPGFTTTAEQTVYTYDANGSQLTKKTSEKTETNTYNALNQLVGFTDGETTASYAYNVSGLRIEKTVDGETINHVWDGSKQIVADIVDNDFYEADCYLRGTNLVAKYNYCNGVKSEYTYYTQNAHGDVVNLTDETSAVTKSYTYDAFGVEQNIDDSDTNAFRYCGEYFDAETGTVYLRARYYDPSIGRFISRDSYAGKNEDPLSLNRYTYCHNNPIIGIDPSGHSITLLITTVLLSAALAGGISLYNESKSVGGISNMESQNWKNVAFDTGVGALCGLAGYGFGAAGGFAFSSFATASSASPLIASATSNTLSYAIGTGITGGMVGNYASTVAYQSCYGYCDPEEIIHNAAWGGVSGGIGNTLGYGLSLNRLRVTVQGGNSSTVTYAGYSKNGYNPSPGERTLNGYLSNNISPEAEVSLFTHSSGFNNNNGQIGGAFKRFGNSSHGGIYPHVHQPQVNVAPNGNVYGSVGSKTTNGGVTYPTQRDIKQLYSYLNNGKYR